MIVEIDENELLELRQTNIRLAKLKVEVRYAAMQALADDISDFKALEKIREALRNERRSEGAGG